MTKIKKKEMKCKNCELKQYLVVTITPDGKCRECGKQLTPDFSKTSPEVLPLPSTKEDWEDNLILYLTSAGDRRRTIHFIKKLLAKEKAKSRKEVIEEIEKYKHNFINNDDYDLSVPDALNDILTLLGDKDK